MIYEITMQVLEPEYTVRLWIGFKRNHTDVALMDELQTWLLRQEKESMWQEIFGIVFWVIAIYIYWCRYNIKRVASASMFGI